MTKNSTETSKPLIKRIFHPYWLWEEVAFNMWGKSHDRVGQLAWAIGFTGDAELYGSYMVRVAEEWKYSCEHNLSGKWQNRQAWIGHAACALASKCPEDVVREAWGHLSEEQQRAANAQADIAIEQWEGAQCQRED